ncbi:MAG: isocitrate/isopropylmalate family dehydrogenase [Rickettsiales bacterium]|nr:isocitrate/isopropylmalate family dehydrogenase [Rickettsiales bacterium]
MLQAPPMVYIAGEEMTRVVMQLVLDQWVSPYIDTKSWQFFDLSCKARDESGDQVLKDAITSGATIGAIFKEPTITPTADQCKEMGLKTALGSPNGKMRQAWNGFSIDRDTIIVPGLEDQMGYEKPVLFCRHAVGGEYAAGYKIVGPGTLKTVFTDKDGKEIVVDERKLTDQINAAVTYHNPLDNVEQLAHHFFSRSLAAGVVPYVVTKKTVFKWQEPFWTKMKEIFDKSYKAQFETKGLLKDTGGQLRHLLSDDASMKIVKWHEGGFAMVAHNYDGDWLTDEMAEQYKSPGFISSVLTGVKPNGQKIMEFEASHGTIADQFHAHNAGKETSVNPLGMVHALRGAIDHSATLGVENKQIAAAQAEQLRHFTAAMYNAMCETLASGKGTRDLSGPSGLTTQGFIAEVAARLKGKMAKIKAA